MIYADHGPLSWELPRARLGFGFLTVLLLLCLALVYGAELDLAGPWRPGFESPGAAASRLAWWVPPLLLVWARRCLRYRRALRLAWIAWVIGAAAFLSLAGARWTLLGYWFAFGIGLEASLWSLPWPRGFLGWRGLARLTCRLVLGSSLLAVALGLRSLSISSALLALNLLLFLSALACTIWLRQRAPRSAERLLPCPRCGVQNSLATLATQACNDCGLALRLEPNGQLLYATHASQQEHP